MEGGKVNIAGKKIVHPGTEVSLWIDSYNEIFSDFDPRPFSERIISDDFVVQVKRVTKEKNDTISVLKLLLPEGTQNEDSERIIRKRLQTYFSSISDQLQSEMQKTTRKGYVFTVIGVTTMIIAGYIAYLQLPGFTFKLILTLSEPAGWFLLWTGLDLLISLSSIKKSESRFYRRMENIHVEFGSYR